MSFKVGELLALIKADKTDFDKKLADAERQTTRSSKKMAGDLGDVDQAAGNLDKRISTVRASLQDMAAEFARSGEKSGEFAAKIRDSERELTQLLKAQKLMGKAGRDGAEQFSVSFSERLGPLLAKAPIGPHMATAIGAAAPTAVAVLAAAISGGIAVGGVGAGIALAASDPQVKASARALSSLVGRELRFAARPFVPETLKAIEIVREGFLDLRPDLEGLFADAAKFVEPLTRGAVGGMKELVPALRDVVHNAEPVVDVLGEHLTKGADAAGTSLRLMTQDSEQTAQRLDQLLSAVEGVIVGVGGLVAIGNKAEGFLGKLGPVGDAIKTSLNPLGPALGKLGELAHWLGKDTEEAEKVPPAVNAAGAAMLDANTAARIAADGTKLYTEWLNKQNQAYEDSIDDAISAERATLRFAEATATAKEATDRKKGASVAERSALLSMIEAANTATTANEKQGISSAEAARKHKTQRDALIAVATKMFGSRDAAIAYVDKLLKIPASRRTEITAQNAQALGAIAVVRERLDTLNGKTVKTYIKVVTIGGVDRVTSNTGGGREVDDPDNRRAAGGPVRRGLSYLVGEQGPELWTATADGYITPAEATRRMLTGARSMLDGIGRPQPIAAPVAGRLPGGSPRVELPQPGGGVPFTPRDLARALRMELNGLTLRMVDPMGRQEAMVADYHYRTGGGFYD